MNVRPAYPNIIGTFSFIPAKKWFRNWYYTTIDANVSDEWYGEEVTEDDAHGDNLSRDLRGVPLIV